MLLPSASSLRATRLYDLHLRFMPRLPRLDGLPARMLQGLAAASLLVTISFYVARPPVLPIKSPANLTMDSEVLRLLNLDRPFEFRRFCINAKQNTHTSRTILNTYERALSTQVKTQEIQLSNKGFKETIDGYLSRPAGEALPSCQDTVSLDVPEFESYLGINTSSLMLGVATTLKRIEESIPDFSRWLSRSGTILVVLLTDQSSWEGIETDLSRIHELAAVYELDLIFEVYQGSEKNDGRKNFELAPVLVKHQLPHTQWFGVIDDDTFFLSLPRLLHALSPYDPALHWYAGALSELFSCVSVQGFMAWGGAGIFISSPLMEILAANAIECQALDGTPFGDLLWRDCILATTSPSTPLTQIPGLNQIDVTGDTSGWYEAPRSALLTLHHWKSWHRHPTAMAHLVADVAGPESILQRYLFPSSPTAAAGSNAAVLTNGYSYVEYPRGVPDLNRTEKTFGNPGCHDVHYPDHLEFHHSLGTLRPRLLPGEEKISWTFELAVLAGDDTVRQFYVRRPESEDQPVSIVEVDWRKV